MKENFEEKTLGMFLFFLPLLSPLAYIILLFYIIKRVKKLNFKKLFISNFLFFDFILFSLLGAILVSSLLSSYKKNSFSGFILFCLYILVHFLMREIAKKGKEKRLLYLIFLSLFFLCGFGIIQYIFDINISFHKYIFNLSLSTHGGVTSLIGQQNRFASILVLTIPLVLTFIFSKNKNKIESAFFPCLLFLGLFCTFLTKSLAGMAAVGFTVLFYIFIKNWKLGLILALIGGVIFLTFRDFFFVLFKEFGTLEQRVHTWVNVCIPLIREYPLLGTGLATYSKVASSYSQDALKSHAHSLYFNYLGEIGLVGGGLLLLSIILPLIYLVKATKKAIVNDIALGFILSIVGILIFGTVETVLNNFRVGLLFWSLLGIGVGICLKENENTSC